MLEIVATSMQALSVAGALLFGFLSYRHARDRDRKGRLAIVYGDALAAVMQYRNLPFRVRRRTESTAEVRGKLANLVADVHEALNRQLTLMAMESPPVREAYERLVREARDEVGQHIKAAWLETPIEYDEDMNLGLGAVYDTPRTDGAILECAEAMRQELGR